MRGGTEKTAGGLGNSLLGVGFSGWKDDKIFGC